MNRPCRADRRHGPPDAARLGPSFNAHLDGPKTAVKEPATPVADQQRVAQLVRPAPTELHVSSRRRIHLQRLIANASASSTSAHVGNPRSSASLTSALPPTRLWPGRPSGVQNFFRDARCSSAASPTTRRRSVPTTTIVPRTHRLDAGGHGSQPRQPADSALSTAPTSSTMIYLSDRIFAALAARLTPLPRPCKFQPDFEVSLLVPTLASVLSRSTAVGDTPLATLIIPQEHHAFSCPRSAYLTPSRTSRTCATTGSQTASSHLRFFVEALYRARATHRAQLVTITSIASTRLLSTIKDEPSLIPSALREFALRARRG